MGAAANRKKAWEALLKTFSEQEKREWEVLTGFATLSASWFEARKIHALRPLHIAANHKHIPLMQALLAINADPNVRDAIQVTPLMYAITNEAPDIVKILLEAGADINAQDDDGLTALFYEGDRHDEEMIRFLLDAGADPTICDNDGCTAGDLFPFIDELVAEKKAKDEAANLAKKQNITLGNPRNSRGGGTVL